MSISMTAVSSEENFFIPEDDSLITPSDIGNKIDPKYENRPTPLKIKKVLGCIFTTLSVVFTITGIKTTWCTPLLKAIVIIGVTATSVFSYFLYQISKKIDYDNPNIRKIITDKIANQTLSRITQDHPFDEILDYDLLKTTPSIYKQFAMLSTLVKIAKNKYLKERKEITNLYLKKRELYTSWIVYPNPQNQMIFIPIVNAEKEKINREDRNQKLFRIEKIYNNNLKKLNQEFAKSYQKNNPT